MRVPAGLFALLVLAPLARAQDVPVFSWPGDHTFDQWGDAVALVGDVDGDGVGDVAVGWQFGSVLGADPLPVVYQNVGRVEIYSGATGETLHLWHGGTAGFDRFGAAIVGAGDVDGDGHADVLVGAPTADGALPNSGAVQLRSGADGSVMRFFGGFQEGSHFGLALTAGDLDGDGIAEAVIGAPYFDLDDALGGYQQEGCAYAYRLTDGAQVWARAGVPFVTSLFAKYELADWGGALAYAGDSDGDGLGEILVGAAWSDFSSSLSGTSKTNTGFVMHLEPATLEHFVYRGGDEGDLLGASVAALGDADGDGQFDIAAGATGANGNLGEVRVWSGTSLRWTLPGTGLRPVGGQLAVLGDPTQPGSAHLLVGAPRADLLQVPSPLIDIGAVELRSGADGSLVHTWWGAEAGEQFGRAVDGGALAGEGFGHVLVGAPHANTPGSPLDSGAAHLYAPLTIQASWTLYGAGLAGTLGVPALDTQDLPVIGSAFVVDVGNSSGDPAQGYLALGLAPQSLAVKGGTLLVDAQLIQGFPLPKNGRQLTLPVAADLALEGLEVFLQVLQTDPGAPLGVSFTRGMQLRLGG